MNIENEVSKKTRNYASRICAILAQSQIRACRDYGTCQQLADTVKKYSSAPMLDVQRFWEMVLFSWITGNYQVPLWMFGSLY